MATSKKRGIKSSAQDNFLKPNAPTIGTATNVGTSRPYNNGSATVAFTASGSGPAATSFTATSSPGGYVGSSATSPITVTGLQSNTSYTFTVTASNNNGTSSASSSSNSITATTVPDTPAAPVAQQYSTAQDYVYWTAPNNGGSAITNYYWTSSDGKSGNTSNTYVYVNQEMGTSQTYNVRADNANGSSGTSSSSNSVTTPFSVFGFFGAFYNFAVFFFAPPFFPPHDSLASSTLVRTTNGLKPAKEIQVGDKLYALDLGKVDLQNWQINSTSWNYNVENTVETTVVSINSRPETNYIVINGDIFTPNHFILVKKDNIIKFLSAEQIDNTFSIYSHELQDFILITHIEAIELSNINLVSINCEPYNNFFTENMLVFDNRINL